MGPSLSTAEGLLEKANVGIADESTDGLMDGPIEKVGWPLVIVVGISDATVDGLVEDAIEGAVEGTEDALIVGDSDMLCVGTFEVSVGAMVG